MRTMLLLTTALLIACNGGTQLSAQPGAAATSPASVTLQLTEVAAWGDLELRWVDFEDSRCAIGVNCVWAGRLQATVAVTRAGDTAEVKLINHLKSDPPPASAFGYQFRLLGMQPHPKEGLQIVDSDRRLRIGIRQD